MDRLNLWPARIACGYHRARFWILELGHLGDAAIVRASETKHPVQGRGGGGGDLAASV
jgi:hypothetical protein